MCDNLAFHNNSSVGTIHIQFDISAITASVSCIVLRPILGALFIVFPCVQIVFCFLIFDLVIFNGLSKLYFHASIRHTVNIWETMQLFQFLPFRRFNPYRSDTRNGVLCLVHSKRLLQIILIVKKIQIPIIGRNSFTSILAFFPNFIIIYSIIYFSSKCVSRSFFAHQTDLCAFDSD